MYIIVTFARIASAIYTTLTFNKMTVRTAFTRVTFTIFAADTLGHVANRTTITWILMTHFTTFAYIKMTFWATFARIFMAIFTADTLL